MFGKYCFDFHNNNRRYLGVSDLDAILSGEGLGNLNINQTVDALLNILEQSETMENITDISAAYHIGPRNFHKTFAEFNNHIEQWIPTQSTVNETWLKEYINYLPIRALLKAI